MDKIVIEGGRVLNGEVEISGAKNSVLSILAATLLTDEECVIENVPELKDIDVMCEILHSLNVETTQIKGSITVKATKNKKHIAPYDLVRKMRASICVLGPLLVKLGKAQVSLPGGCVVGPRPIDLHLKGLKELGANIGITHGYIRATCKKLKGSRVYLGGPFGSSVLATANIMMAASLAEGQTIIENAACEPEISDLACFLIKMGADIKGHGTYRIRINGKKALKGAKHCIIPDRIEAGTYIIASAITKGNVKLKKCNPRHLGSLVDKVSQAGVDIKANEDSISIQAKGKHFNPVQITTLPYPGFPTDMQAQIMSLMSVAKGSSIITERVYPERFLHISELNRMGADITLDSNHAIIRGVSKLSGAPVMASDLRASAALILAGLVAENKTVISRIYHLDRGYHSIEKKLSKLGASIKRIS